MKYILSLFLLAVATVDVYGNISLNQLFPGIQIPATVGVSVPTGTGIRVPTGTGIRVPTGTSITVPIGTGIKIPQIIGQPPKTPDAGAKPKQYAVTLGLYNHNPAKLKELFDKLEHEVQEVLKLSGDRSQGTENQIAKLVRAGFHDCVGGCDGCIDLSNPNNFGLEFIMNECEKIGKKLPEFSFADIIAYATIRAMEIAVHNAGNPSFKIGYYYGRWDCNRDRKPENIFPAGGKTDSIQFLKREFRIDDAQAIALLGCHSLGRCHAQFSGFTSGWDRLPEAADEGYFENLINNDWSLQLQEETLQNGQTFTSSQWSQRPMMLHADMITIRRFTTSGPHDTPSCNFAKEPKVENGDCPVARTTPIVEAFCC